MQIWCIAQYIEGKIMFEIQQKWKRNALRKHQNKDRSQLPAFTYIFLELPGSNTVEINQKMSLLKPETGQIPEEESKNHAFLSSVYSCPKLHHWLGLSTESFLLLKTRDPLVWFFGLHIQPKAAPLWHRSREPLVFKSVGVSTKPSLHDV